MTTQYLLCSGKVYRGVIIVEVVAGTEKRTIVVGTANRQAVQLYECADYNEAVAFVDAALLMTALPDLPVCENDGGARAVKYGFGSTVQA